MNLRLGLPIVLPSASRWRNDEISAHGRTSVARSDCGRDRIPADSGSRASRRTPASSGNRGNARHAAIFQISRTSPGPCGEFAADCADGRPGRRNPCSARYFQCGPVSAIAEAAGRLMHMPIYNVRAGPPDKRSPPTNRIDDGLYRALSLSKGSDARPTHRQMQGHGGAR